MIKNKLLACILGCALLLCSCSGGAPSSAPKQDFTQVPSAPPSSAPADSSLPQIPNANGDALTASGYNAMWISYLEWKNFDTQSENSFRASIIKMLDNCAAININTMIIQVRPFADAIYESALFPKSHLLTGTQGQDNGYDAFKIIIEECRARQMRVEAWINPYRIALNDKMPKSFAESSLKNLHPDWAKEANGGIYLEPSNPEVQKYIVDGVIEVVQNYDIDGVQFDDYFYPTTDKSFDAAEYAASGTSLSVDEWRRENVNSLIKQVYTAVHATKQQVYFGISPQGNNDNNYNQQYSDVKLWLSTPGYADYIMPQLYWGFNYTTKSGSEAYKFDTLVKQWAGYPRDGGVALYIGLGPWRIGAGDGGANDQAEWKSGSNTAKMVAALKAAQGVDGYALYRYDSLFNNPEYQELCNKEIEALKAQ